MIMHIIITTMLGLYMSWRGGLGALLMCVRIRDAVGHVNTVYEEHSLASDQCSLASRCFASASPKCETGYIRNTP
jgi:hypothetical protein